MKLKYKSGVAAVELAIVLPILLVLLFGIIEFSLVFYNKAIITNASREAARAGIVLKSPKLTNAEISKVATDYCATYLISFAKTTPAVTVEQPIAADGTVPNFSTRLRVSVSYDYSSLVFSGLIKLVASDSTVLDAPLTLTAITVMRNE